MESVPRVVFWGSSDDFPTPSPITFYLRDKPDPYLHVWFEKPQQIEANRREPETRDIAVKLEELKKYLVIFWGSQSGTAEGFANRLVRDFRGRFSLDALAADLADYDPESIANIPESKFAIFIISTYGDGDPSDNATHFLSWLGSNRTTRFSNLRYAAFGLGNKNYKFYNRIIDVVTESLDSIGATPLLPVGKADDSKGTTDEDFTEWKHALFAMFCERLGFKERPNQYEPALRVVEDTSLEAIDLHIGEPVNIQTKKGHAPISPIRPLPIKDARRLLSTTTRNCLHLELDTNDFPELKYKTGDHLAVWPSNPSSDVQQLANCLGLQERLDIPLLMQSLDPSIQVKVPSPTTWDALLQYYLEICAPVSRDTVTALAHFAPSETAKATLKGLGGDKDVYQEYCSKTHVTLGRLLEAVSPGIGSWSNLPLAFVIESLPTLSPRYYSISSSSIVSPKQISITVATSTEASLNQSLSIPGVTTNYLSAIEQDKRQKFTGSVHNLSGPSNILENRAKLFAHIRTSKFRLPTIPKHPIIMIASGSGIAPFRGFLAERARMAAIGREVGKNLLFFGCRSEEDFLYRDELQELPRSNSDTEIVTAFSRAGERKVYVQDRVEERDEEVVSLLEQNAYFYICGSAAMARDVTARLGKCLMKRKGWSDNELRGWSESIKKAHRWQEDVWG
ncbi:riboflavin synthase domain-like protein [Mollisia scopiformis]|uniref:NADPH--cytochrome P450 reductase n=1 Tax=Mollisia scopiformis TaxID=149040 RepID=A0A194XWK7_MOLSC|nr:riboflavin synthase domain-like protein [Mollisia scopiformis]KUJ24516.1 riboflavin synthase domain-like protein [Mollisia scopiformis]